MQELKLMKRLASRHVREKTGFFLAEGVRLVEEALSSGWHIESLFYAPGLTKSTRGVSLLEKARALGVKTFALDDKEMLSLSQTVTPQGVMAVVRKKTVDLDGIFSRRPTLVLVVDAVRDPGNLGTIIRAADGAKCGGVIMLSGTTDPFGPKAIRASMGSALHLPLCVGAGAQELLGKMRDMDMKIVVADARGEDPVYGVDLQKAVALVVSSEASGPNPILKKEAHHRVHIPMPGMAESLNVAVAAGIILYETLRQRYGTKDY